MIVKEKLSLRSSDYFVAIGIEDGKFLSRFIDDTRGVACVARFNKSKFPKLKDSKIVDDIKNLDDSVFDKVLANYSDDLNIKHLVRIADHFGLVLIQNVPYNRQKILSQLLQVKAGIFEIWSLSGNRSGLCDLLFKVRKYRVND
jgi:hypothetical protein